MSSHRPLAQHRQSRAPVKLPPGWRALDRDDRPLGYSWWTVVCRWAGRLVRVFQLSGRSGLKLQGVYCGVVVAVVGGRRDSAGHWRGRVIEQTGALCSSQASAFISRPSIRYEAPYRRGSQSRRCKAEDGRAAQKPKMAGTSHGSTAG